VGGGGYELQYGSFSSAENAQALAQKLASQGQEVRVEPVQTGQGTVYRVRGGAYSSEEEARQAARRLQQEGIEAYVVNP
jgi:DedD protein